MGRLSQWLPLTTLCDYFERIIIYFHENAYAIKDDSKQIIYIKLYHFKYTHILYFIVDVLHIVSMQSRIFQHKVVDITTIHLVLTTDVIQIHMFFIDKTME